MSQFSLSPYEISPGMNTVKVNIHWSFPVGDTGKLTCNRNLTERNSGKTTAELTEPFLSLFYFHGGLFFSKHVFDNDPQIPVPQRFH